MTTIYVVSHFHENPYGCKYQQEWDGYISSRLSKHSVRSFKTFFFVFLVVETNVVIKLKDNDSTPLKKKEVLTEVLPIPIKQQINMLLSTI